jgi:hypothetical protein
MAYGYGNTYASRRSAPPSVHVVAVLQYLGGALLLVGAAAIALVTYGGNRYQWESNLPDVTRNLLTGTGIAVAAVLAFVGLFTIVVGRRLQRGRQWARVLVIVLSLLGVAATLYNGIVAVRDTNALYGLVFPVLYLLLLNTRAARSWFRARTY